jgi:hypothetical protein
MTNHAARAAVERHIDFMDRNGSHNVDFKEFAKATIDAADQKVDTQRLSIPLSFSASCWPPIDRRHYQTFPHTIQLCRFFK